METFFEYLEEELEDIRADLKDIRPLVMTNENWTVYNTADTCWVCGGEFHEKDWKVKDHDHITGEFRGAAHNSCNINLSIKPYQQVIPVFFHNLKG